MSAFYPGTDRLPEVPPPWHADELELPRARRPRVPEPVGRWLRCWPFVAFVALCAWCWKGIVFWFALWLVGPILFPWPWGF